MDKSHVIKGGRALASNIEEIHGDGSKLEFTGKEAGNKAGRIYSAAMYCNAFTE